jgi:hypothetical protein
MNQIRKTLLISLTIILLFACKPQTSTQIPSVVKDEIISPTPVTVASPTQTKKSMQPTSTTAQTSTPSITVNPSPTSTTAHTPTPSITVSPSPTSTQTPGKTPDQSELGEGNCVIENASISITTEIFQQPDFENRIAEFLNEGGPPFELGKQLGSDASAPEPNLIQVIQPDINSDGISDVLMTITLHYFDGNGETHVLAYICDDRQYSPTILFRRAGAGSRAEGLYSGGGAKIESTSDLNQDGRIEILFSINWPGYAEYYLLNWVSGQFTSLIEYTDILGNTRYSFDVEPGNVKLEDVDNDGIYELVVTSMNYQTMMEETSIWFWDGVKYSLPDE